MSCPRPHLQLSPLPRLTAQRHPLILLVGQHQPNLLKHLEGWPKHWPGRRNCLIRFAGPGARDLRSVADNTYDLVVVGGDAPCRELIGDLVRVARQGLISLR